MPLFAKVEAQWFLRVLFVDVTEMFHQTFFERSLGLTNVEFIAVSASEAIDDICAVATEVDTAFKGLA